MWKQRLQTVYSSFDEFEQYSEMYGLHNRLGFNNPQEAWDTNPIVEGSTNPADYKVATIPQRKGGK